MRMPPSFCRITSGLLLVAALLPSPVRAIDAEDAEVFIRGFNAFHKKEYASSVQQMETLLKKYPKSPLRDLALFWLAKGYYKKGDRQEAARLMAQFFREYPESQLKPAAEEELQTLADLYAKGAPLPRQENRSSPPPSP